MPNPNPATKICVLILVLSGLGFSQNVYPVPPTDPHVIALRRAMAERHLHWELSIGASGKNYCLIAWTDKYAWAHTDCDATIDVVSKRVTDYFDQAGRPKKAWVIKSDHGN